MALNIFKGFGKGKDSLKPNEKKVIELLLSGNHPTIEDLRTQFLSNNILGVERSHGKIDTIAGIISSNEKSRYQLQFVLPYEKSMASQTTQDFTFRLDDLVIINKLDGKQIFFDLIIHEGELSILLGVVKEGDFPFEFEIKDWDYKSIDNNGSVIFSKERDFTNIPIKREIILPSCLTEFQKWILSLKEIVLLGIDNEKLKIRLDSPVSSEIIAEFERENGIVLPNDYKDLIKISNGCGFFGEELLGINDCYRVDEPRFSQFLVFHAWIDGNFTAINLEDSNSIYYICHDPLGYKKISGSFKEWLECVAKEIKIDHQLYHPSDNRSGSIYWNAFRDMKKV